MRTWFVTPNFWAREQEVIRPSTTTAPQWFSADTRDMAGGGDEDEDGDEDVDGDADADVDADEDGKDIAHEVFLLDPSERKKHW